MKLLGYSLKLANASCFRIKPEKESDLKTQNFSPSTFLARLARVSFVNANIQASIESMRLNILLFLILALFGTGCVQENRYDSLQGRTLAELQEIHPLQDNETTKLGIAFGGGGMRGFVHLGVIQALEEAEIQAEIVTGTSAGAIAAVLYASSLPLQQIHEEMIKLERWDVADPVISLNGLIQGRKLASWINQILGNKLLSELPKRWELLLQNWWIVSYF